MGRHMVMLLLKAYTSYQWQYRVIIKKRKVNKLAQTISIYTWHFSLTRLKIN